MIAVGFGFLPLCATVLTSVSWQQKKASEEASFQISYFLSCFVQTHLTVFLKQNAVYYRL
nr:MAG TPA: hypothetical protein [Caudoviricetes sp.]